MAFEIWQIGQFGIINFNTLRIELLTHTTAKKLIQFELRLTILLYFYVTSSQRRQFVLYMGVKEKFYKNLKAKSKLFHFFLNVINLLKNILNSFYK